MRKRRNSSFLPGQVEGAAQGKQSEKEKAGVNYFVHRFNVYCVVALLSSIGFSYPESSEDELFSPEAVSSVSRDLYSYLYPSNYELFLTWYLLAVLS